MFAILAEHDSDADVLTLVLKRHLNNDGLSVKKKGYDGCGGLCAKGARDIKSWAERGISHFIICHDADSNPPAAIREKVAAAVVRPSGHTRRLCCIVVPVQEIEAWLIADEAAINAVIPSFGFEGHPNPETIRDPKEWLVRESEAKNGKPRYSPRTFNAAVARHLRFEVVLQKCPSFRAFLDCVSQSA
jgi:Domain of unknown function (DUF4276)